MAGPVLPSLFDLHPGAGTTPRRTVGVRSVPLDRIVGTMRHPSQNTADFLPLPRLRGANWSGRWQRINRAMDALTTLPPLDLVQVGDDYYVVDGHNRVAAARRADAVEIDADVTQLLLPGVARPRQAMVAATSLVGWRKSGRPAAVVTPAPLSSGPRRTRSRGRTCCETTTGDGSASRALAGSDALSRSRRPPDSDPGHLG